MHRVFGLSVVHVSAAAGSGSDSSGLDLDAVSKAEADWLRRELLDRILIINRRHAAAVLREFQRHYNHHRPHRSLGQTAPSRPLPRRAPTEIPKIKRHDRLGGLLHEYQQAA